MTIAKPQIWEQGGVLIYSFFYLPGRIVTGNDCMALKLMTMISDHQGMPSVPTCQLVHSFKSVAHIGLTWWFCS